MDDEVRITLRLPEELRDWLRENAQRERRSLNSEIIYMLEVARTAVGGGDPSPLRRLLFPCPAPQGSDSSPA